MIKFTETFPQYINFGNGFRTGFTQRSVIWSAYFDAWNSSVIHGLAWITPSFTEELLYTFTTAVATAGRLVVNARWSGGNAQWATNSAYNTTGQWYRFGFSYDAGATTNDPIIYVNGAAVALTELVAPSGTYPAGGVNQNFGLGGWGGNTIDGKVDWPCLYDRILTPEEFALDYAERKGVAIREGLRFAPHLNGCTGKQSFNGLTLSEADLLIDPISGATGTPKNFLSPTTGAFPVGYGSEIARGETA